MLLFAEGAFGGEAGVGDTGAGAEVDAGEAAIAGGHVQHAG